MVSPPYLSTDLPLNQKNFSGFAGLSNHTMAVKPNNRVTFYSSRHGRVQLVKRSVGYYTDALRQMEKVILDGRAVDYHWVDVPISYWRGQLVEDWAGEVEETGESWSLHKGQVIWLNAANFTRVPEYDYLDFEPTD